MQRWRLFNPTSKLLAWRIRQSSFLASSFTSWPCGPLNKCSRDRVPVLPIGFTRLHYNLLQWWSMRKSKKKSRKRKRNQKKDRDKNIFPVIFGFQERVFSCKHDIKSNVKFLDHAFMKDLCVLLFLVINFFSLPAEPFRLFLDPSASRLSRLITFSASALHITLAATTSSYQQWGAADWSILTDWIHVSHT